MGLYGERAGAFSIVCSSPEEKAVSGRGRAEARWDIVAKVRLFLRLLES